MTEDAKPFLDAVFDGSLDVLLIVDMKDQTIVRAGAPVSRILGYDPESLVGRPLDSLLVEPAGGETGTSTLEAPEVFDGVVQSNPVRREDGSTCYMDMAFSAVNWRGHEAMLVTLRDATERKEARDQVARMLEEVRKSREDLLSILNALRLGVIALDENERIGFINRSVESLAGVVAADVAGRPWPDLLPLAARDRKRLSTMLQKPARSRSRLEFELEFREGHRHWLEVEVVDDPRDSSRKMLLLYDISEIHLLRRQLQGESGFQDMVGRSEPMNRLYRQIRDLAEVDVTVLIEGETGTGKELVARALHSLSHRRSQPFVPVNCAGLTESLAASQLFGHRKGAFTGAVEDRAGVFEAARGGTLFLDEIGDVPLPIQPHLLRALQEREIFRVGDSVPKKVDLRFVAATNRDLQTAMAEGGFRRDLYYRARVGSIRVPPLRERIEDVPLLVRHFLDRFRAAAGKAVREVDAAAMRRLMDYDWPGNVRELQNVVESSAIRCRGKVLRAGDLPEDLQPGIAAGAPNVYETPDTPAPTESRSPAPPSRPGIGVPAVAGKGISEAAPYGSEPDADSQGIPPSGRGPNLADVLPDRRRELLEALRKTRGNRAAAARMLGIGRSTLYRRLQRYGLLDSE